MKKKIVFFDGDGTLWYPKATKYSEKPHWVYMNPKTKDQPNEHMQLIPGVVKTLKELKKQGTMLVVLSASPHKIRKANAIMKEKIAHFNLDGIFHEVHATRPYVESKGTFILEILSRYGLNKKDALMVGDSYLWDCKSAKDVGVEALTIDSEYRKSCPDGKRARKLIKKLNEVLDYV